MQADVGNHTTIHAHFEPPFRISIQACTLLNGNHPAARPLTSDLAANNFAMTKHRMTSPFPHSDRTPTPVQRNRLSGRTRSPRENLWLFELPCDPGFDSASKIIQYQEYFIGVKAACA